MTIPWQPGPGGNLIVPPGYVDPHSWSPLPGGVVQSAYPLDPPGTLARTIPTDLISSGALASLTTGGQVGVRAIALPAGVDVNNVTFLTGSTAASGPTHLWVALCDVNLNVLGVSADQLTAAVPANTYTKLALGSPVGTLYTGVYYIAISASASTTAPTLAGFTVGGAAAGGTGGGVTRFGSAGTQATPPAVGAQLNSGTISGSGSMNFAAWLS